MTRTPNLWLTIEHALGRMLIMEIFLFTLLFHKAWDAYMQEVVLSEWG